MNPLVIVESPVDLLQEKLQCHTALWLCGLPAPTVCGWTCATEFQAHERWNGVLKDGMPGVERNSMTLATATASLNCSIRSNFKNRGWTDGAEEVPAQKVLLGECLWPGGINAEQVCQRMVSGDPVMGPAMEEEEGHWQTCRLPCPL